MRRFLIFASVWMGLAAQAYSSSLFEATERSELEAFRPQNLGLVGQNPMLQSPEFEVNDSAKSTHYVNPPAVERQSELYKSTQTAGAKPGTYSQTPKMRRNSSSHRLGNRDAALTFGWSSTVHLSEYYQSLNVEGSISAELFESFKQSLVEGKVNSEYYNQGTPALKDDKANIKADVIVFGKTFEVYNRSFTDVDGRQEIPDRKFTQTFVTYRKVVFLGYVPITLTGRLTGTAGFEKAYAEETFPGLSRGLVLYAQIVPTARLDVIGEGEPGIAQLNRFLSDYGAVSHRVLAGVAINVLHGGVRFSASADKDQTCLRADTLPISSLAGKAYAGMEFKIPLFKTVVDVIDYLCQYDIFNLVCSSQSVKRFKQVLTGYANNRREKVVYNWPGTNLNSGTSWGQYCDSQPYNQAFGLVSRDAPATNSSYPAGTPGGSTGTSTTPSPGNTVEENRWEVGAGEAEETGKCIRYKGGQFNSQVDNVHCGKPEILYEVQPEHCFVYENGSYSTLINRGVEGCPAADGMNPDVPTPGTTSYQWDYMAGEAEETGRCNAYENGNYVEKVDNFLCGKASLLYEVGPTYCYLYVNGNYDKILDRGEEACPAADFAPESPTTPPAPVTPVPTETGETYLWYKAEGQAEETGACYRQKSGDVDVKVANSFCGKPASLYEVNDTNCYVFTNGAFDKLVDRGVEGCPSVGGSTAGGPDAVSYKWLLFSGASTAGYCVKYVDKAWEGQVDNHFCGQDLRQLERGPTHCSEYVNGKFARLIENGLEDCPL